MRLFDSIMKNFDDDSLGLLGAVLGEHEVKVRDGVEAAIPEILSAIGDQTKSEAGRGMLWRELRDTDESISSSFPSQLHYQNSLALVEKGREQLSGLVGDEIKSITNRVSHAADIGSSSAGKMVGAVSPLIFSSLAAWQKKEKVDAEGWQKLFAEQGAGLRERAARATARRFDEKTGQRTFPSFEQKITTGQGGAEDKWTVGSGFTPGYEGAAKEKFSASNSLSSSTNGSSPSNAKKVAAGAAGAAAVAGIAAAGGQATGSASSAKTHSSSIAASSDGEQRRWVPDKENLRRERERTAIERARVEREQRLAKEERGGLGWLWWQLALLAGLAWLGWTYRAEITEAFNGPTPVATSENDLTDESTPMLPSEEAALQSSENIEPSSESSPEDSETAVDAGEAAATKGVIEGAVESTTAASGTGEPSSPSAKPDAELASPPNQQNDDAPKLAPMDGAEDTQESESVGEQPETATADSTEEAGSDEDVDLQVETALTSLELGMKEIKDEASAKSALPQMEEGVSALEELMKTSSSWSDVDKELIDIQLEEAAGVFAKLNESTGSMPNVKDVLTPLFERLEKLLVPQQTAP